MSKESFTLPTAESLVVEFKAAWSNTVKSTFCSFVNTAGGTIYLGIDDEGTIVGVSNPDEVERAALSVCRFAMQPPCDNLFRTERRDIAGKVVVIVHVAEGDKTPYSVTVKDEGRSRRRVIYIRKGSCDLEVNDDELRALYRKSNPTPYELQTSRSQDLSFDTLSRYFEAAEIPFQPKHYPTLGITNNLGFFTHLGFWLSDQSTVETRVGFFKGTDKASQTDGIYTFAGCIVDQYSKIRQLLSNRFGFAYEIAPYRLNRDGTRNEVKDYPENAVREALINMFAHRDYSREGQQAFVSSFSDHLEFLSFGGLPAGCDEEHLLEGVSSPRNAHLAELLMRLSAMEKYGIGIPTIFGAYKPFGLIPELICRPTMIKILLPKIVRFHTDLTEREQSVVDFLRSNPDSPSKAVQAFLGKSPATAVNTLISLQKKQVVVKVGAGRTTRYRLK